VRKIFTVIKIENTSQTALTLVRAHADVGAWETEPVPGAVIGPKTTETYVNYFDAHVFGHYGYIFLDPASGGQILVNWSWRGMLSVEIVARDWRGIFVDYYLDGHHGTRETAHVTVASIPPILKQKMEEARGLARQFGCTKIELGLTELGALDH
jgi:hypothetical protein